MTMLYIPLCYLSSPGTGLRPRGALLALTADIAHLVYATRRDYARALLLRASSVNLSWRARAVRSGDLPCLPFPVCDALHV